jgi:transcriptional regulator NrdR family protein
MTPSKAFARSSILCPVCGKEGRVTNSRTIGDVRKRWRRCKCTGEITWTTTEGEPQKVREAAE